MFKKNIVANGKTNQLGGKDIKALKASVLKHFPSLSEADQELLAPTKTIKLSTRTVLYCGEDGNPLLFDPNGHGDKLIPTVIPDSIHHVPCLLPPQGLPRRLSS